MIAGELQPGDRFIVIGDDDFYGAPLGEARFTVKRSLGLYMQCWVDGAEAPAFVPVDSEVTVIGTDPSQGGRA